jgi:hopanoid C-3 methylase HpnR
MKLLAVHPSGLMYTKIYLRLEPLGLELVAAAARAAGHQVRLIDLQVETHRDYFRLLKQWRPDAVCFAGNYLANVPEIIDLAKATKAADPGCFVFAGGHSVSFTAEAVLAHGEGAIDCVLKGEGEAAVTLLLERLADGDLTAVPGAVTPEGEGPPPIFARTLDRPAPARDLLRHRRKYFIGVLDPAASIEFARGCPWDCTFCSAWTFYGRSYRTKTPEAAAEEMAGIAEPGVFIVDDVAFIHQEQGMKIADAVERRGIRKRYYLETRCDVLLRNKEVFRRWRKLGLEYMFLGLEALDEDGLKQFRKRTLPDANRQALEFARSLGITVAINLIVDPAWDVGRFEAVRRWCLEMPEIVNLSVMTPYPGTEIWHSETRRLTSRDYRLFDIQHAVLPTKLPLPQFYAELVKSQQILNSKHLGLHTLFDTGRIAAGLLAHGQTNFLRMLWKFNSVFNPALQLADHHRPVRYQIPLPERVATGGSDRRHLYIHKSARKLRALDAPTERFVAQH